MFFFSDSRVTQGILCLFQYPWAWKWCFFPKNPGPVIWAKPFFLDHVGGNPRGGNGNFSRCLFGSLPSMLKAYSPIQAWPGGAIAAWSMSGLHLMMLGQLPYKPVSFPSSEAFRCSVYGDFFLVRKNGWFWIGRFLQGGNAEFFHHLISYWCFCRKMGSINTL